MLQLLIYSNYTEYNLQNIIQYYSYLLGDFDFVKIPVRFWII